jgi:hypothetical protein
MRPILLLTLLSVAGAAGGCGKDITGAGYRSDQSSARADNNGQGGDNGQTGQAQGGGRTVPFKAHYEARIVSVGPGPGCDGRLFLAGEGTGTYLGHFTITLGFCGRADGTLDTGTGTFVAANGDLLNIVFHGVSDGGHPILHFTSYVSFTGGTGRFEGATGTATVKGIFDAATGSGPGRNDHFPGEGLTVTTETTTEDYLPGARRKPLAGSLQLLLYVPTDSASAVCPSPPRNSKAPRLKNPPPSPDP